MKKLVLLLLVIILNSVSSVHSIDFYMNKQFSIQLDVHCLVKLSNSSTFAIGLENGGVLIWNHETGGNVTLNSPVAGTPPVHTLFRFKDSKIGASATKNSNLRMKIWNEKGTLLGESNRNVQGAVTELNSGYIASSTDVNSIIIWDLFTDTLQSTLVGHTGPVKKIIQLTNGNLASCSDDGTIRVWNLTTATAIMIINAHTGSVRSIIQLTNGSICSCGDDTVVKVWDINDGSLNQTMTGHTGIVYTVLELSNGQIASGSEDGKIIIWGLGSSLSDTVNAHASNVYDLVQLADGKLVSASSDDTIRIWSQAQYRGCYIDQQLSRDLSGLSPQVQSQHMTYKMCFDICVQAGFTYAGLQFGIECFCDNSYGSYGVIDESECNMACSGNPDQFSGGLWRNYVFQLYPRNVSYDCDTNDTPCLMDALASVQFLEYSDNDTLKAIQILNDYIVDSSSLLSLKARVQHIGAISNIAYNIANRNTTDESQTILTAFVSTINNILLQPNTVLKAAQAQFNSSRKYTESLELMAHKTRMNVNETIFRIIFDNVIVKVAVPTNDSSREDFGIFSHNTYGSYNPAILKDYVSSRNSTKLSFILYENAKFFDTPDIDNSILNCAANKHISNNVFSISSLTGVPNSQDLVTFSFSSQRYESCSKPMKKRSLSFKCVYWEEDTREWSGYGCQYIDATDSYQHTCHCNHTTHFALLMMSDDNPFCDWCEETLKYLTLVFVIISIIGLTVTLFYDLIVKFLPTKKSPHPVRVPRTDSEIRNHMSRQLMNVITTWFFVLLTLDCVYLAFAFFDFDAASGKDLSEHKINMCIFIGVLLHFFLICSFCLALSISFLQYYLYFKSFRMLKFIFLKAIVFSFAFPLLCITIVLCIDKHAYINDNNYCWLNPNYSVFAVILPIAIMTIINLIFFLLIILNNYKMYRLRKKIFPMLSYPLEKKSFDIKEDFKKCLLKISLVLSCFYYNWSLKQNQYSIRYNKEEATYKKGISKETKLILTSYLNSTITWLFGFLVTIPGNKDWIYIKFVFALIFCILNASLGIQILVVYIIIAKSRRQIVKTKLSLKNSSKDSREGSSSEISTGGSTVDSTGISISCSVTDGMGVVSTAGSVKSSINGVTVDSISSISASIGGDRNDSIRSLSFQSDASSKNGTLFGLSRLSGASVRPTDNTESQQEVVISNEVIIEDNIESDEDGNIQL